MSRGYIKLHGSLTDHTLWLRERFTSGQAWADLLMLANYRDGRIFRGNRWGLGDPRGDRM